MKKKGLFDLIEEMLGKGETLDTIQERAWQLHGAQCAVLVMDSSGFTKITKKYGIISFLASLIRARRIIEAAFRPHGNLSFRTEADNVYAEFKTPVDAYYAAVNARRLIAADSQLTVGDIAFDICVGIGFGEVLQAGHEGVYGDEMNLASKLGEDIATSGQILLTESAHKNLDHKDQVRFSKLKTTVSGVEVCYYQADMS